MKTSFWRFLFLVVLGGVVLPVVGADMREVGRVFREPGREYATAPLWVWNDRLTEEQVRGTMRGLESQHVRQVFVHPRPGLMTPYLSGEWFDLWRVALEEAKRLDMNVWIYDENSYPSGFAGGWVPELMPESRGRGLHFREVEKAEWGEGVLGVWRMVGGEAVWVSEEVRRGVAGAGPFVVAEVRRAGNSGWHGGRSYVDLLYPGVTEKFLEVTLGAYEREVGDEFGGRIPGVFTDEPELIPAGGMPWTEDLPAQFEKRWGYALLPNLVSLEREVGDWHRVRHNYHQTLLDLFIERWAEPYYRRCEELGLEFTGHYWEHDWPVCRGVPDNMAMAAWQQRPGIDILMNQYAEHTHAQFGNVRSCREISSVANQLGRARTLVEVYGAGGWDLRFEDMKRIADWLLVLGVNTLDEHLSYITLRGARKRDHPQSFSYHEPWWPEYGVLAQYFTRLSAVLSQGEQVNPVLVLEPTTTAWMHQGRGAVLGGLGNAFSGLLMELEGAQVAYDLGCEDVLAREGGVRVNLDGETSLRVGEREYAVVVLPEGVENLNGSTVELLRRYLRAGGVVLSCGQVPVRVDGVESDGVKGLAGSEGWHRVESGLVDALAHYRGMDEFRVERAEGDRGILFHHRRELPDGQVVFLVNTSLEQSSRGEVWAKGGGVEVWDAFTGERRPAVFEVEDGWLKAAYDLAPAGSELLVVTERRVKSALPVGEGGGEVLEAGGVEVRRVEPNILTLDYVDVEAGGERLEQVYFYEAGQFAFRKNGMERNPWDSAVQFGDELITRTFAGDSGVSAVYRFEVRGGVPVDLEVVVERPDLYAITCNGQEVVAGEGAWWLDRAFGRIGLVGVAREGMNELRLEARPFTILHELEPVYVRGSFALESGERGFVIVEDSGLVCGEAGWNAQGHPFYSGGVEYRREVDWDGKSDSVRVRLPSWYGSVATVSVNGKEAGVFVSAPWEVDVSDVMRRGRNEVVVKVVGTLKNTLGPHHAGAGRGSAWPGMFHQGPKQGPPAGAKYDTIGYGLFAPFEVWGGKR